MSSGSPAANDRRRTIAKRSIVGTTVAAKRSNGLYMPATVIDHRPLRQELDAVQGVREDQFLLKFEVDGKCDWFVERHIIGQGACVF